MEKPLPVGRVAADALYAMANLASGLLLLLDARPFTVKPDIETLRRKIDNPVQALRLLRAASGFSPEPGAGPFLPGPQKVRRDKRRDPS